MTVFAIIGIGLVVCVAIFLLTAKTSTPRRKERDLRASESIAVWTSSSEQEDDRRREP